MLNIETSKKHYREALNVIPGGVNSPVRAFKSVQGDPLFIKRAKGSRIWDVDDNEFIDYVGSWGALLLGHAHDEVVATVAEAAQRGLSYGAPTENETILAQLILSALPALEKIRFVSSGTEACMTAIRLARAYTKRDKVIKFTGNYHGHSDMLLAKAGSGLATLGIPDSPGVPADVAKSTITLPYNNISAVEETLQMNKGEVACLIIEPFVGNAGFIRPEPGYLMTLQKLCREYGVLFILDEVITGFRVTWGGAQTLLGLDPDLTTLGKIIGGGLPLAAFGGKKEVMDLLAPQGPVYQAGTLSGNPLATSCGIKTLLTLNRPENYAQLAKNTNDLCNGLITLGKKHKIPLQVDHEGALFGLHFNAETVKDFETAQKSNIFLFRNYFMNMLENGVYLAPSAFEAGFVSLAHTGEDIKLTLEAAAKAFEKLSI